jgi:hypothetical protein
MCASSQDVERAQYHHRINKFCLDTYTEWRNEQQYIFSLSLFLVSGKIVCAYSRGVNSVHYMYGFCQLYRHFSPLISSPLFSVRVGEFHAAQKGRKEEI